MPLVSLAGDRYLGMDSRPEVISNLVVDQEFQKAMSASLMNASATGAGSVVSVPIKTEDLRSSMMGVDTRQVAPMQFAESRAPVQVPDVQQAAVDHRHFGMGYIDTFRSDKPPSGLNFLREPLSVPVDPSIPFNQPTNGPYNTFNPNGSTLLDPRYAQPNFSVPSFARG